MLTFISGSPTDTENFAEKIAQNLKGNEIIALRGGLGVGKTRFTAGLCSALGYKGYVTSPTFSLVNEYKGGKFDIYHYDMYRIASFEDLYSTGYFDNAGINGITVIEWSENIDFALDGKIIFITLTRISDNERKIEVEGEGF